MKKIKGLDFLRVYGIFLVLVYHFFPTVVPAGFLGVNILFVLSGFLITYHLIDEFFKDDGMDIKKFYYKRFVRIFPPVLLMLFLTTLAALGINKDYTVRYFDQFIASFSFMYNYFEMLRGGSYEGQFINQLFMHMWSLAIEIHFYILWPLVMSHIYKKSRGVKKYKRKFSVLLARTCLLIYIVSYLLMAILAIFELTTVDFVYFFDLTRIGSFVMGALMANFVKRYNYNRLPYNKTTIIGIILIFIMSLVLSYTNKLTYGLGFLLTDLITVFIIMVAYSNKEIDEGRIMPALSNYTYGIYIFHWPSYVISTSILSPKLGLVVAILVTAALVAFNYHIFEPLFRGKDLDFIKVPTNKLVVNTAIALMVIISFVLSISISKASSDMISLEKQILVESIHQDIDKIKRDKDQLTSILRSAEAEENEAIIADEKADTYITMLGDSVLLGHREYLTENIPNLYINAEGSRELAVAPDMIRQMEAEGNLGNLIIIALGTNAVEDPEISLENIVEAAPEGSRLIFVTAYDSRYEVPHRVSKAMHKVAPKYDFVTLMEWEDLALDHPEYYEGTDGVHFYGNWAAYEAYLKLLEESIDKALLTPSK